MVGDLNGEKSYLSTKEFADEVNYSESTIRKLLRDGRIKGYKANAGRKWLIPRGEVTEFLGLEAQRPDTSQLESRSASTRDRGKWEHLRELARVAEAMLGWLGGLRRINDDEYEFDRVEDSGLLVPLTVDRKGIIEALHLNIEKAYDAFRSMGLFDLFVTHLQAENPTFGELDKGRLHEWADASPMELIELLKTLALGRTFKGTCLVCEDW